MKNKHPKRERAKKTLTHREIVAGVSPFNSAAWRRHMGANHRKEKERFHGKAVVKKAVRKAVSKRKKVMGIF